MVAVGITDPKNLEDQNMYEEIKIHACSGLLYFASIFERGEWKKENRVYIFRMQCENMLNVMRNKHIL